MKHKNIFIEQWIKNVIEIITFPNEQGGSHDKRQNEKNMLRLKEALLTINEVEIGKTLLELIRVNVLRRGKLKLVTLTPQKICPLELIMGVTMQIYLTELA